MEQDETLTIVKRKRDAAVAAAILLSMGIVYFVPAVLLAIFSHETSFESQLLIALFGATGLILVIVGIVLLVFWLNKQMELLPDGLRYTSALGLTSTYSWDQIKVYDLTKKKGKLVFDLAGKKVSFGKGYIAYEDMRQDLLNQGHLLDAKGHSKQAHHHEELVEITPLF